MEPNGRDGRILERPCAGEMLRNEGEAICGEGVPHPRSPARFHYLRMRLPSSLALLAAFLSFVLPLQAQTPRLYLNFNGNVSDTSRAGVITGVTPSTGWTPAFQPGRNTGAGQALDLTTAGARSLQLVAASLPGNSNQALGLRSPTATNTSFTLSAWIYCSQVSGGYNTVFGNLGSGTGT